MERDENRNKRIGHVEEEIERQALALCKEFAHFTTGTRYVTLLHRSKDGGENKEHKRRGGFYNTHSPEEFRDAVVRLLMLKTLSSKPYRLYSSVNGRDVKKAERAFKMDMLMCDFADEANKAAFWKMIPHKWNSALMQPGSRTSSYFLLDVDGEGDITAPVLIWLSQHGIEPLKQYKTPNGWHIITQAFNPNDFTVDNCEIQKDGLLLLAA